MIIYLHAAGLSDTGATYGRHIGREVHQIIIPENTSPNRIREIVLQSFEDGERESLNNRVELLLINSHGSPGRLHLGGIMNSENDIDIHNSNLLTEVFQPLLKPMNEGGEGVEIHGCGIASGSLVIGCDGEPTDETDDNDIGFRFIYALACGFDNRVLASVSPQVSDYEGYFEDSLIYAEPSVVCMLPDDDPDVWRGHVINVVDSPILHAGGTATRIRAMTNPPPILDDPRTERRVRSGERFSRHSMRH